ncbi:MAG: transglutaminaseTgpA domain-containing protein [Polyangia bacterium]
MPFAATQKVLTYLLALAAVLPLLLSGEVSAPVAIGFPVLAAVGWFLEPPLTRRPGYRRAITAVMLALLAVQLTRAALGTPLPRAGFEYVVALLGLKLCSRGGAGDYQQIAVLAFLHLIGATIATFDLLYAAALLVFVVLSPPVLALSHLRAEMERRFRHDDRPEGRRALARLLASKRVVGASFLAGTGLLSVPILLFTALLFVAFPRFGLGLFGRLPGGDSISGFAGEVRLGDLELNRRDSSVAIRLEPLQARGDRPEVRRLMLRGAVFDLWRDGVWKRSDGATWRPLPHRGDVYPLGPGAIGADGERLEVLLESLDPSYLFLPRGTSRITTFPVAEQGILRPRRLEADPRGVLRYEDSSRVGLRYRVTIAGKETRLEPALALAGLAPPLREAPDYLQLPDGSERLVELAGELAGEGSPGERARRLVDGLRGRFRYADRPRPGEGQGSGETPLDRFLFSRRSGTCEHFATALTLMLRAEGIEARMVTGFATAEWNPLGEYWAVRLRSAHAWTEARLGGRWVTLDATPPAPGNRGDEEVSTLALLLDAVRMRWHRYVIGFDTSSQMEIVERLRRVWRGSSGSLPDLPRPPGRLIGLGLAAVAGLLLAGWLALRWWRGRRGRRPGLNSVQRRERGEATRLYLDLQRRLESLGLPRPAGTTPREHAAAVEPELGSEPMFLTCRYNEVRFGKSRFDPGELSSLRERIAALERHGDDTP